ncbi:MAG: hypothetical protein ACKOPB_06390 [Actinomycetota bacterium]
MPLSVFERRRIVVLSIVSMLALVVVRSTTGGSDDSAVKSTTTYTTVPPIVEDSIPVPVILGGPAALPPSGTAAIAKPATSANEYTGTATFTVLGYTERAVCYSTTVPQGQNLVVTNINNGQSIKCLSVYSTLVPPGIAIVLHQSVFVKLSDLIDAPIPVKVTW